MIPVELLCGRVPSKGIPKLYKCGMSIPKMTRKEVKMSGKIKIGGLVLAAALGVLWAWFAYGGGPSKNPCGSQVVGVGLKAVFLPQYVDLGVDRDDPSYGYPRTWDTIIQHDVAGLP